MSAQLRWFGLGLVCWIEKSNDRDEALFEGPIEHPLNDRNGVVGCGVGPVGIVAGPFGDVVLLQLARFHSFADRSDNALQYSKLL
ncbi:hypothetical protein FF011L_04050 [Roseimaritima multifibrata]|uniref:Uncharacterized protein n=1 Tax=Roseimaritima multifibrata TaxID=1930274 RepID=A0A517M9V6_9BACT|nr:hypothetical protein FF011L_04050 [Roseimaritima multifibrata]